MAQHQGQRSYTLSGDTLKEAAGLLEAISNLNYLAWVDARNTRAVERWTSDATILIKEIGAIFSRSRQTNIREVAFVLIYSAHRAYTLGRAVLIFLGERFPAQGRGRWVLCGPNVLVSVADRSAQCQATRGDFGPAILLGSSNGSPRRRQRGRLFAAGRRELSRRVQPV